MDEEENINECGSEMKKKRLSAEEGNGMGKVYGGKITLRVAVDLWRERT